jgi:hypothetical protein
MKRPRTTRAVVEGILDATSVLLAGDVASAFGADTTEPRWAWDRVCKADKWARQMRDWFDQHTCQECQVYPCVCRRSWLEERRISGV